MSRSMMARGPNGAVAPMHRWSAGEALTAGRRPPPILPNKGGGAASSDWHNRRPSLDSSPPPLWGRPGGGPSLSVRPRFPQARRQAAARCHPPGKIIPQITPALTKRSLFGLGSTPILGAFPAVHIQLDSFCAIPRPVMSGDSAVTGFDQPKARRINGARRGGKCGVRRPGRTPKCSIIG